MYLCIIKGLNDIYGLESNQLVLTVTSVIIMVSAVIFMFSFMFLLLTAAVFVTPYRRKR